MDNREKAISLLKGGYDLHVHTTPSHIDRLLDDIELVEQANHYKMDGVMIKNHYESTAGRASLINHHFTFNTRALGGVVLNWPVGGINPYAVESALKLGAKFVWLPTRDSLHCLKFGDMKGDFFKRPGISILDDKGKLISPFYEVLEVIKKYDGVLATGHVSVEESILACEEARKQGVKTVLTHPDWYRTKVPKSIQVELAKNGVKIEKLWANLSDGDCSAESMIDSIKSIGTSSVFISTDRGQKDKENPLDSILSFIELLLDYNFTESEIKDMVSKVPEELVK
ncbi:hypothetical protein SAMN02745245_00670 [Anaerosphaera aminiphila DSM 21120]|uniref:Cytosolic protein n=1 Tax=Anaerosphaera aminiphila DSM 21120 TaxID=1120995 RepID=A0A1M5QND9_9FIRM|nr:DUF6282 family protein [Anaerosphaera aminiphila]SHH15448.1 hypothetical protein SAMN02745245_00670 [Anaerosphaera aminiphila DSM 21120]